MRVGAVKRRGKTATSAKTIRFLAEVAVMALAMIGPAGAAGLTSAGSVDGGTLLRGGAPLPEFHLDFLLDDAARLASQPPGSGNDIEISLNSGNNSIFRFPFSPRPQFGFGLDKATGASRAYAGLTWNLFDLSAVFGNFGVAGSYNGATPTPGKPSLPPLMMHGALELGYHITEQNSVSLSIDRGVGLEPGDRIDLTDNLRLRYGLKF